MVEYRALNGVIVIEGDDMIVTHRVVAGRAVGPSGQRRIPLATLSGVTIKPASVLTNGYLGFAVNGTAAPSHMAPNSSDAVMFSRKEGPTFQQLHDWLQSVVQRNSSQNSLFAVQATPPERGTATTPPVMTAPPRRSAFGATDAAVDFELWGRRSWPNFEVAGESYHSAEIAALFRQPISEDGEEAFHIAALVPDPSNPHDSNAVRVEIDERLVGYLPKEEASRYQGPLTAMHSVGLRPIVPARIWARPEVEYDYRGDDMIARPTGHVHARVSLHLAEPHMIRPLNASPGGVELPTGRAIKVSTGESSAEARRPWLRPEGEGWVYATLHRVEERLTRSTRQLAEVRIDGLAAGHLTPAMSQNFLPVVDLLVERGLPCVVRAIVKGNQVKSEVSIDAVKASELTAAWLEANIYAVPVANITHEPPGPGE